MRTLRHAATRSDRSPPNLRFMAPGRGSRARGLAGFTLKMSLLAILLCASGCDLDGLLSPGNDGENGDGAASAIDAVFFAQTHVQRPDDELFRLVSHRAALIKVQVTAPGDARAPAVVAVLDLDGQSSELVLEGPEVLPESVALEPGVVEHRYDDSFTAMIPADWIQPGLSVTVRAGDDQVVLDALPVGAPTTVHMTMFDMHYFALSSGDYPAGWEEELEAKWPVADLQVQRTPRVVLNELVIPPRGGAPAARVSSKDDYQAQTGLSFDGEQAAALQWVGALKAAAGTGGRIRLYYVNIHGVPAGGQAGGFAGVGHGRGYGILNHELGHALSLPHWGNSQTYPYRGEMHGIPAPSSDVHVGPTWAFDLPSGTFIPPTVQENGVGGTVGTYKKDPMQGGGTGDQEEPFIFRHFSDYSVNQMRDYLERHVLVWNDDLGSYAKWDQDADAYTAAVANDGLRYPVERNVEVVSVMAGVSAVTPEAIMVYAPIGPYVAGRIDLLDPNDAADRQRADQSFCPSEGCDVSLRIVQGGVEKICMLAIAWDTSADPTSGGSYRTRAVNLPAGDGAVTSVELLLTPDAEKNGLPAQPQVLDSWTAG